MTRSWKLNLRDLFWLVLVVALALGWWLDRSRLAVTLFTADERANRMEFLINSARANGWTIEFRDRPDGSENDTIRRP